MSLTKPIHVVRIVMLLIILTGSSTNSCSGEPDHTGSTTGKDALADTAWPMVGHDRRHTCLSPARGPRSFSVKWTTTLPSTVFTTSGGAIDGSGNLILGTMREVLCISPQGQILWQYVTAGSIYGSPAIASDGTVYVTDFSSNTLYAFSSSGTLKWTLNQGDGAFWTSPAIGKNGTIYVSAHDSYLYAVNPDGSIKWRYYTAGSMTSPAVAEDGTIYLACLDGYLHALTESGKVLWRYRTHNISLLSSPAIGQDGTIYCYDRDYLLAVRPNGKLRWEKKLVEFNDNPFSPGICPDGSIIVVNGGVMFAVKPDGQTKWTLNNIAGAFGFPAIDREGTIYMRAVYYSGGSGYNFLAVDSTGHIKWGASLFGQTMPILDGQGTLYTVDTYNGLNLLYAIQDPLTAPDLPFPGLCCLVVLLGLLPAIRVKPVPRASSGAPPG